MKKDTHSTKFLFLRHLLFIAGMLSVAFTMSGKTTRTIEFHIRDASTKKPLMAEVALFDRGMDGKRSVFCGNEKCGVEGIASFRIRDTLAVGRIFTGGVNVIDRYEYVAGERNGVISESYDGHPFRFEISEPHGDPYIVEIDMERKPDPASTSEDGDEFSPSGKMLQELTVTATKIEFYYKGDTLIYNADAFKLGAGSSLDQLLAKMPGIDVRGGGVIYCNGRRLERLLINGRNLFNDQNELMLENIAAYTVRDIAVYDKRGRISELMGLNTGDSEYVMDVRLKREYSVGGTVNADAAYGTHDRYMGKLFGMWYSDFMAMTAYGNANNLRDQKRPGVDDYELVEDIRARAGTMESRRGGLTYNAKGYKDRWEATGSVDVHGRDRTNRQSTTTERYYQSGNIYQYGWSASDNRDLTVTTKHHYFTKLGSKAIFDIWPEYTYGDRTDDLGSVSAQYRTEMPGLTREEVVEAFALPQSQDDSLINRRLNSNLANSKRHNALVRALTNIKILDKAYQPSMLTFEVFANYQHRHGDAFNRYRYQFGDIDEEPLYSHLYRQNHPDREQYYHAEAKFTHFMDYLKIQLPVKYRFSHTRTRHTSSAYRLSSLGGYDVAAWPLDTVPSDYASVSDPSQSYRSLETANRHQIEFTPQNNTGLPVGKRFLFFVPEARITFLERDLKYFTNGRPERISRHTVLPDLSLQIGLGGYWHHDIRVEWRKESVPLSMFVDKPSDGLIHQLGNADIRNTEHLNVRYRLYKYMKSRQGRQEGYLGYERRNNSAISASFFNRNTGETYYKTFYSRGDYDLSAGYDMNMTLDSRRSWKVASKTDIKFSRNSSPSMAFTGTPDLDDDLEWNSIDMFTAREKFRLTWKRSIFDISAVADIGYRHYSSDDLDINDFSAWTCNYGATALLTLPLGLDFSTDLMMYTRRGYMDSRANTTDLVWNARLSKSVMNGSLIFSVDGYDILQQLNNISFVVTDQARIMTVSNTIPSYVLFGVAYRIGKKPPTKNSGPGITNTITPGYDD